MSGRPQVAIVGAGAIGRVHARLLRDQCDLTFASRRRASAETLAARFGGSAADDLDDVLARPEIRGVVLATPAEAHAEAATRALEAGKVVLVEKPMAVAPEEVGAIGAALESRPAGSLMVAENYLYKPSLRLLLSLLPEIGPVRRVELRKLSLQRASGWRAAHGALLEGGIHFVALLGAILAERPDEVEAEFPGEDRPERHSRVELRYPSGATALVEYAWDRRSLPGGVLQHSRVVGERGSIVFESNGLYLRLRAGRRIRFRLPGFRDFMGFEAMARDFRRLLADPLRAPRSGFERARRDLDVVFRASRTLQSS